MEHDRDQLLTTLADAQPALGESSLLPELAHYWFDKEFVYAYNSDLGIRLACATGLECGVPGKALIDLLRTTALKTVTFTADKAGVALKFGRSTLKLAVKDPGNQYWPYKDPGKTKPSLVLSEELLSGMKQLTFVRTGGGTQPLHHGVAVIPTDDGVELYATDSATIARVELKTTPPKCDPFIAPWPFVAAAAKLAKAGAPLYVADNILILKVGDTLIGSNLLEFPDEPDIVKIVDDTVRSVGKLVALPEGLGPLLQRATILAGKEEANVTFTGGSSELKLAAKFEMGDVAEVLTLSGKTGASGVTFLAERVLRGLKGVPVVAKFGFDKNALTFWGGAEGARMLYMVASH